MKPTNVSKPESNARAMTLVEHVEASGKSLIVTNHGKPVLEVRTCRDAPPTPLDLLRGSVIRYDYPTDPVDQEDWSSTQ